MVFPPKVPDYDTAVGYWGSEGLHDRIQTEEEVARWIALLRDKIFGSQSPAVMLYLPVTEADTASVPCTCVKATATRGDARCRTCHQTKRAPGYRRFLHETVFACSSSTAGFTLVGVELDTEIQPHRLRLVDGALTGTITTGDRPYDNTDDAQWETNTAAYRMVATDTVVVEFSTDAGTTWTNVTAINGANRPVGAGQIRFRITLTRAAATTESPSWEITRARHPQPSRQPPELRVLRNLDTRVPRCLPGEILLLRTWSVGNVALTQSSGRQTDISADRSWTMPLNIFDLSLTRDTPECRIFGPEEEQAAHPFFVHTRGVNAGDRYAMFQFSYNETMGRFTHQAFGHRRTQRQEAYALVW